MNKSRQLNIRLLDYWISVTGTADGPSIDEQVCRDSSGLPYFPASALKGVLKHAIDCAEAWGYYEDIKTQKGWANILFGHATTRDNSTSGILEANNAELPSDLKQLLSIEPKYRETLHRTLHATAIDDANGGVAKDKSLRGMEVTLPLPNPLQTIIRVKDSAANAEWDTVLERALPLVTAIGKNRTRGLGRVQLTLTPILDMPPALHQNHPSVSISENSNFTPGLKHMILNIECLQESILSQQGGSATQHETLDYIPGARLMGAVAALYKLLEPAEARWLFESGNVRFGDARRVTSSGKTAIPSPLSYHHPKSKLAICKGYLDIQAPLIDLVYPEQQQCIMVSETQWSTLAPCEIDPETGEHLPLAKQFRMRTAVDAVTGGAANAQLYGHESSVAGLRFRSEVVARASSPAQFAILMKIRDQIQNLKSVGKYRSSGYGQIDIKAGEWEDVQLPAVPTNRTISLHLLSDLAVCNQWGQPTLTPESTDLHLPAGQRLDYLCFVKTRRYSSYNSY